MHRTMVYLTDEQARRLRALAARTGRSQADLIREGVDGVLASAPPEDDWKKVLLDVIDKHAHPDNMAGWVDKDERPESERQKWLRENWYERDA